MKFPAANPKPRQPANFSMWHLLAAATFVCATASAQVDPATTFTGAGTTYTTTPGNWASSLPPSEVSTFYAAINNVQYGNSEWCGAWIQVTGPAGTAAVQIVDKLPTGAEGDLDLSPAAFSQITGSSAGIFPISWKWIAAPGDRGAVHFYSEGSNPYYLKLQVANTVNPPASMQILYNGGYVTMSRTSDHHFVLTPSSGPISEPFTIKVIDIFGNELVSSGLTISGTAAASGQNGSGNFPAPGQDISVELPAGTTVADGGTADCGLSINGNPASKQFTIRNTGTNNLTGLAITKDGVAASEFTITADPAASIPPGGTTTFTIAFASTVTGTRTAAIHIANSSSNPALSSYDINLTGGAFSSTVDTDEDGLNDAAEAGLAALGFIWNTPQPELVDLYYQNADLAGLHTAAEIQTLNVGTPLLKRDASTGKFTLTLGLTRSENLMQFQPFPFVNPGISINGAGKLEFQFNPPSGSSFSGSRQIDGPQRPHPSISRFPKLPQLDSGIRQQAARPSLHTGCSRLGNACRTSAADGSNSLP